MQILFLVSAHNSLSQRAWIALTELGHDVAIAVVDSRSAMEAAVRVHAPELIVCPFLKTMIPESIWARYCCLIVHPGPSSLDWAIELEKSDWGVTVLQATGEVDAGEVWATSAFSMRKAAKSSLYRHEVRRAAIEAVLDALDRLVLVGGAPSPTAHAASVALGPCLPLMTQEVRAIDWTSDGTDRVLRKIRAGDGHPGVLDTIDGKYFHLFGGHPERTLGGRAGELLARRDGAICRATVDGAVWITHLKRQESAGERHFKLPAARALARAGIQLEVPEVGIAVDAQVPEGNTYREIAYHEHAGVGYLRFAFYNGAMSTSQCVRLREAYAHARAQQTKVIVLLGGDDYFSNGIHLNEIEAAEDPAEESWRNLQAIDDLVKDIAIHDRVASRDLGGCRRRCRGRGAAGAGRRLRPRPRGHHREPVLPAHGRAIRIRVLDLPAATARRTGHNHSANGGAVSRDRHERGREDWIARRRLGRGYRGLSGGHRSLRRTGRA